MHGVTRKTLISIMILLIGGSLVFQNGSSAKSEAGETLLRSSIEFEPNRGQFDKQAKFHVRGTNGQTTFLTQEGIVLAKRRYIDQPTENSRVASDSRVGPRKYIESVVTIEFEGFALDELRGIEETGAVLNYLKGSRENWVTKVPTFKSVRAGVGNSRSSVEFHGRTNGFSLDFETSDQDLSVFSFGIRGAEDLFVNARGDLEIATPAGILIYQAPSIVKRNSFGKTAQKAQFRLNGRNRVTLEAREDIRHETTSETLGASTALLASSLFGGPQSDGALAVDTYFSGARVTVGTTASVAFPTRAEGTTTVDETHNGGSDAFISKWSFGNINWSTFLGGSGPDLAYDVAIGIDGNVYVGGESRDNGGILDFPTTTDAYDRTSNGDSDGFVSVISEDGASLIYSTLIGGTGTDAVKAITLDSNDKIYIGGITTFEAPGVPFPTTTGAYQMNPQGMADGFVAHIDRINQVQLPFSTFLGGGSTDIVEDIKLDTSGQIIVAGLTDDNGLFNNFPVTNGAFDTSHNGETDAFVAKLNSNGTGLVASTYLGAPFLDIAYAIVVTRDNSVIVTGLTSFSQTPFPTTPGAYDTSHNGSTDTFISKLSPDLTTLAFSTFLGGPEQDFAKDIGLDRRGDIIVGGLCDNGFPVTPDAYDQTHNGSSDAWFARLSSNGSSLQYSSVIGGGSADTLEGLAVDQDGLLHIAGGSYFDSDNNIQFPVANSLYNTHSGDSDAFTSLIADVVSGDATEWDYDGDGKADYGIFRRSLGEWWNLRSSDGGNRAFQFGTSTDIPAPADFTGDGILDQTFFRPSNGNWFVLRSDGTGFYSFPFGTTGDIPAPGDFDGDGIADPAVFRPSNATWYVRQSSDGQTQFVSFGSGADHPLVGDYDGDGKSDFAVYKPSVAQFWILRSFDGLVAYNFGQVGDIALRADMSGDGTDDIGLFRPTTGFWFILRSEDQGFYGFPFGANGDKPVPADYDGDGTADPAVFRPSDTTWYSLQSTNGTQFVQFGASTDEPIPGVFNYSP